MNRYTDGGIDVADAPEISASIEDMLARATRQLRDQHMPRAVEIADEVLKRSLEAPRPSMLVRSGPPHEHVRVSSTAITALLREQVDEALVDAAVGRVVLDVDRDEHLGSLTLELLVRFGTDILEVADEARALTRGVLADVLGVQATEAEVVVQHVHVSDVTVGDPHVVDPSDEI